MNQNLQAGSHRAARKRHTIKWAAFVEHRDHILRTDWLDSPLNLVDVLTVIPVEVTIVVAEVSPLQLSHGELRGKLEGSFANIALRGEALEGVTGDHKTNLVRRIHPSRVAALSEAVGNDTGDDWGYQDRQGGVVVVWVTEETSCTQRLLIDSEREAAIALEGVATDCLFAQLEGAGRETNQVFLDISIVAQILDLVVAEEAFEELAIGSLKWFGKHLLAEERADLVERLEVQGAVREDRSKAGVDLLHVTGEVRVEALSRVHDIFDAGLDKVLIPNVSVDDLHDGLLKRDLSLKVRALESRASLLDADARACTTKGLKLEGVLSGADLIRIRSNTAEGSVIDEYWSSKAGLRNRHFLDNGTNHVRDVWKRAAADGVDVGAGASQNLGDLPNDAIHVLRREVLHLSDRNTIVGHSGCVFLLCHQPTGFGCDEATTQEDWTETLRARSRFFGRVCYRR